MNLVATGLWPVRVGAAFSHEAIGPQGRGYRTTLLGKPPWDKASRPMTAAYHRSFESKHLCFYTGHARGRISRCAGKRRIALADVHGGRGRDGH